MQMGLIQPSLTCQLNYGKQLFRRPLLSVSTLPVAPRTITFYLLPSFVSISPFAAARTAASAWVSVLPVWLATHLYFLPLSQLRKLATRCSTLPHAASVGGKRGMSAPVELHFVILTFPSNKSKSFSSWSLGVYSDTEQSESRYSEQGDSRASEASLNRYIYIFIYGLIHSSCRFCSRGTSFGYQNEKVVLNKILKQAFVEKNQRPPMFGFIRNQKFYQVRIRVVSIQVHFHKGAHKVTSSNLFTEKKS